MYNIKLEEEDEVCAPEWCAPTSVTVTCLGRSRSPLSDKRGSVGAYSPSAGLQIVRSRVAQYITAKDGVPAPPNDIYLGSGKSDVIKPVLTMLVADVDGRPPDIFISRLRKFSN
ncbi:unnamed protein product [Arctia plantaginis]|uniref:Uncharacterized protein n=1 Tax=Arctia plantaginis TaxID=874455 RepID=A0A8S0YRJ4_ARCPL|nr:unnamed protein product [Arctia plantaginis]